MGSAFFGIHVARSAMNVARGGLDVVAHNTANAENQAFSRQFVEHRATSPLSLRNSRGMIGTGAAIYGVGQHRDAFLDRMFRNERASLGQHQTANQRLRQMELSLNELRGTGPLGNFGNFFSSMQNLATSVSDLVLRNSVLQASRGITETVTAQARSLRQQQIDTNHEVELTVRNINSLGQRIRSLNEQISRTEASGSRANDLRDERNRLIDELSLLVNVEVKEIELNEEFAAGNFPNPEEHGRSRLRTIISINGYDFINGLHIRPLEVVARQPGEERNPTDAPGLLDIRFIGGSPFNIYSNTLRGQLRGLIDVRDGNNGLFVSASAAEGNLTVDTSVVPNTIIITGPIRDDLNQNGVIRIMNAAGPGFIEVRYENLVFDEAAGSYTLELSQELPAGWVVGSVEIGRASNFKGIPHYMNKLNELVRTFSQAINDGRTRNGDPIPGSIPREDRVPAADGMVHDIFVLGNTGVPNWRSQALFNFAVNEVLAHNPGLMSVSSIASMGESHNDVVEGFNKVGNYVGLFSEGRLNDFLISMSGELGIDIELATRFQSNHTDTTSGIHNQRLAVSGVDISEEMLSMLRWQQIYVAAANLINVLDGIYDTTINRLGTGF